MRPEKPLPYCDEFASPEEYISSLLQFITTSETFQILCGGVHILDFFTSDPGLYYSVLPAEWQEFLRQCDSMRLLDLLMRDDLDSIPALSGSGPGRPPDSFIQYVKDIRRLALSRSFAPKKPKQPVLPHTISQGMKPKKVHEVVNSAGYIDELTEEVSRISGRGISHYLDLGSGQNYLGRTLASPPYDKHIIAVESKEVNMAGAKELDMLSGLAEKEKVKRNKKVFMQLLEAVDSSQRDDQEALIAKAKELGLADEEIATIDTRPMRELQATYTASEGKGFIHYVIGRLENEDLTDVLAQLEGKTDTSPAKLNIMAISLHSCGNLSHYGIRSMITNDAVKAVAIVGCCYNLMTERLGPRTYKLPFLRPSLQPLNGRLRRESERRDPQGFPMSYGFATYKDDGIRFNITARMMACQAPANWTEKETDDFLTRHYYRAVLQRIFLDKGVVSRVYHGPGSDVDDGSNAPPAIEENPLQSSTNPVILGSLPKRAYASLTSYVRGAIHKLTTHAEYGQHRATVEAKLGGDRLTNAEIAAYEARFAPRRREISAVWSLMAFSAWVVESAIVADRWLFLREHAPHIVRDCWVEAMFDFKQSPRNLVVVGIKA